MSVFRSLILFEIILLILALGLEAYAIQLMIIDDVSVGILITAFVSHAVSSGLSACVFVDLLQMHLTVNTNWKDHLFLFVIAFFLPLIGICGFVLTIPLLFFRSTKPQKKAIASFKISKPRNVPLIQDVGKIDASLSLSYLFELFRSRDQYKRIQAVYLTLKLKDKDAVALLHEALTDPIDDIRLLAYALLDRKENSYSKRINKNKQALEQPGNYNMRNIYQKITSDYWELVHLNLVRGEAQNRLLEMACKYAETGLKYFPEDLKLRFLYARVLLKQKKYSLAHSQFKEAENLGISRDKLLIFYAEIAFYRHQFNQVKEMIRGIDRLTPYPKLSLCTQYWQKSVNEPAEVR